MDKIIKYGDQKTEITGQDFGIFHVIRKSENYFEKEIDDTVYKIPLWICVDENGKEYELDSAYLRTNPKYFLTWEEYHKGRRTNKRKYNLVGQKLKDWIVLDQSYPYLNTYGFAVKRYLCWCAHELSDGSECGNISIVMETNLLGENNSSCCTRCGTTTINIKIGDVYGKWKVIKRLNTSHENIDSEAYFLCECQCKNKTLRPISGKALNNKNYSLRCGVMGCDENVAIIDENRNLISHRCNTCGEMKPANKFRKNAASSGWHCLDCVPFKEKRNKWQQDVHSRYMFYVNRAKNHNWDFEFSEDEFEKLTSQPCFYCGGYSKSTRYIGEYCGIDRLNSDLGYIKDNCVPCCHECNVMKMDLDVFGFLNKVEEIYVKMNESRKVLEEQFNITEDGEINRIKDKLEKQKELVRNNYEVGIKRTLAKRRLTTLVESLRRLGVNEEDITEIKKEFGEK